MISDQLAAEMDFEFDLEFEDAPAPARSSSFSLRPYQTEALDAIRAAWEEHSRILAVLATGCGKTVIFSNVTAQEVARGGRVLILAHTDELLDQALEKLEKSTGLRGAKEKANEIASATASVVVGSIQTLTRTNRLTGFADNHFTLVIVDESHRILAPSYQKVVRYFHFGRQSLDEDWVMPEPGVPYEHKARVLGVTATADRGDKRSLGEFFQSCVFDYGLLEAVRDGFLVRPITHNIPLQIDLRGVKTSRSAGGSDYDIREVVERITPFLREAARNIAAAAHNRKTVIFLPSVDTASLLASALCEMGLDASFVSGACPDRKEKLAAFDRAGPGSAICNAMLLTEGWDCPDVSCICVLRPTKIRGLYVQCVGRGTRPLPGIVDGLASPAERLRAIAASAKTDLRILDFLWLSDRLDLVQPIDLVATRAEIRNKLLADGAGKDGEDVDLVSLGEKAERDLLESLEKAAAEHQKKKTRIIDPLAWAVSVGDDALAHWEPITKWDELAPTPGQLAALENAGIDVRQVRYRGQASKLMDRIATRRKAGLCTPKQLNFLKNLGIAAETAALLSFHDASAAIEAGLAAKQSRPPAAPRAQS